MKSLYVILCLALCANMAACKKDTATNTQPIIVTKDDLLVKAPWKFTKMEVKTKDSVWIEKPVTDFLKSITVTYRSDHTFTSTSASNTGGTETTNGTWELTDNETVLKTISGTNSSASNTTIVTLSATTLQFAPAYAAFDYVDASGTTVYYGLRLTQTHS